MDYSFHRKLRGKPQGEPDLDILLALASAAQATSPTARAQARVAEPTRAADGLGAQIALFGTSEGRAGDGRATDGRATGERAPHRFAAITPEATDFRQPS